MMIYSQFGFLQSRLRFCLNFRYVVAGILRRGRDVLPTVPCTQHQEQVQQAEHIQLSTIHQLQAQCYR